MGIRKFERELKETNDILIKKNGMFFSYRVGGILIRNNKILLTKDANGYTIPGGHVEIGETSAEAVVREFKEESNLDVEIVQIISTYENFWKWKDIKCHQICFFYLLKMKDEKQEPKINEDDLDKEFSWIDIEKLEKITLFPEGIVENILDRLKDERHFIVGCEVR